MLLIQGMAGHAGIWGEPLLSGLARDFDVIAFEHRGIGESSDVPGEFSVSDLAEDAAALMDVLGWPSAHVFGISLGGMAAQELVLKHPERVRGLVLGCTYAGGAGSTLDAPGPLRMLEAMSTGDVELAVRAGYEANLSPAYRADESHYEPFKAASLSVRVPVPTVLRQAQAAVGHDTSTRLGTVTAPTLVIHGTADQMLLPSNGEQIARLVPGARLHLFADVGHLFWWERPDETLELIRDHCVARFPR